MAAPQAVLDAEAEADRMISELAATEGTPNEEVYPTPVERAGDSEEAPARETATNQESGHSEEADELRAKLTAIQEQYDKLSAQHDTLKGKTYAEVPRVISENKQLRDRVDSLEAQLAAKPAVERAQSARASEILTSIKEDVSEDVADKINRLVEAIVEERVGQRIAPVEGSIAGMRQAAVDMAEERYLARLTALVPDWRVIANMPEYSEFLAEPDELSGTTAYELAKGALERLDADHMARFFNKFKSVSGAKGNTNTEVAKKPSGKEQLLQPRGNTPAARESAGSEKPDYITVKQMEQFTRDRRERRLTEKQETELEARIDRAIQKGWIVP